MRKIAIAIFYIACFACSAYSAEADRGFRVTLVNSKFGYNSAEGIMVITNTLPASERLNLSYDPLNRNYPPYLCWALTEFTTNDILEGKYNSGFGGMHFIESGKFHGQYAIELLEGVDYGVRLYLKVTDNIEGFRSFMGQYKAPLHRPDTSAVAEVFPAELNDQLIGTPDENVNLNECLNRNKSNK